MNISLQPMKQPVNFKGHTFKENRRTSDQEDRVVLEQWSKTLNDPGLVSKATVSDGGWVNIKPDPDSPKISIFANKLRGGGCYVNLGGYEMSDNFSIGTPPEQVSKSNVNLLRIVIESVFNLKRKIDNPEPPNQIRDFVRQYLPPKI